MRCMRPVPPSLYHPAVPHLPDVASVLLEALRAQRPPVHVQQQQCRHGHCRQAGRQEVGRQVPVSNAPPWATASGQSGQLLSQANEPAVARQADNHPLPCHTTLRVRTHTHNARAHTHTHTHTHSSSSGGGGGGGGGGSTGRYRAAPTCEGQRQEVEHPRGEHHHKPLLLPVPAAAVQGGTRWCTRLALAPMCLGPTPHQLARGMAAELPPMRTTAAADGQLRWWPARQGSHPLLGARAAPTCICA